MTFSGPVEIPGVHLTGYGVLPAGTYVFKLLDSQSDRHIVQIFSQDEKTVYATILAIPNYRLKATDKTVITFSERPAGEPEALRAWFYPGKNWGDEFVYPKARAMEMAKDDATCRCCSRRPRFRSKSPSRSSRVSAPVVVELKRAPIMAVQPTGEEVQLAAVVTPPPADGVAGGDDADAGRADLPATAQLVAADRADWIDVAFRRHLSLRMIEKRARVVEARADNKRGSNMRRQSDPIAGALAEAPARTGTTAATRPKPGDWPCSIRRC